MLRTLVVFVALVVCVTCWPADNKKDCPENSYWNDCGSLCEGTCEIPETTTCPTVCVEHCTCMRGYLWNGEKCVLPEQCPIS
ncbi:hypothetical protein KPH14_007288 [Odynerus spinipes]|uniref:TIL domain-containing protein n=1 Tax=Odynerus spinipes TaxID=1348599 RepID=A0AAD9RA61_9HYME|nr:hypothetical protein KPH14_007288 [Odynerus spinipes]